MSTRSQTSSCAAPQAASMLLIPGATPASYTTVTPRASASGGELGGVLLQEADVAVGLARLDHGPHRLETEEARQRAHHEVVRPRRACPRRPASARSATTVATPYFAATRPSASGRRSATVTARSPPRLRSMAMVEPTMPPPRTSTVRMAAEHNRKARCPGLYSRPHVPPTPERPASPRSASSNPAPGRGPGSSPSENPATGAVLGQVRGATREDYEAAVEAARARFVEWRMRPAPRRAELVRRLGELLRRHKEALGDLISLEMGKIRAEGLGEVQEMIDICDFAVGLEPPALRADHRLRAPAAPDDGAVAPARARSASSRRSTSPWPSGRGTRRSPPSAATRASGSPRRSPRSRPLAVQHLCDQAMADRGRGGRLHARAGRRRDRASG